MQHVQAGASCHDYAAGVSYISMRCPSGASVTLPKESRLIRGCCKLGPRNVTFPLSNPKGYIVVAAEVVLIA